MQGYTMSEKEIMSVTPDTAVGSVLNNNSDISDIPQRQGFLPYLGIAYGTSDSVMNGLARPGEFVFEGKTSLGKSVEVIVADFRLHLSVWDDALSQTESDCYAASNDPQRGKSAEYLAYKTQTLAEGKKLHEGVDLLLWIPSVNSFAVIYLKSTTYDSFAPIYNAGRGNRLVKLTTNQGVSKKTKRTFFTISALALDRAVVGSGLSVPGVNIVSDIAIPRDFAVAAVKKFKDVTSTEVSSETNNVSDR
jgi:hypothetical protein